MICPKCNAMIPDGSTACPECGARVETHIGSFAGSGHWEDEVKPPKSERARKRSILIGCAVLALVLLFDHLCRTGTLMEIIWFFRRLLRS